MSGEFGAGQSSSVTLRWRMIRAAIALILVVYAVRSYQSAVRGSYDFDGFHRAAQHVLSEGTLSRAKDVVRYLPHFQVFMIPLALLPVGLAGLTWFVLNVAALFALPRLFERISGVAMRDQWPAWLVAAPFIADNLHLGQSGPLLLWTCLVALDLAWRRCGVRGGTLLALAAQFKLLPAALFAVPLVMRRAPRVVVGAAVGLALGTGAMLVAVGWEDAWSAIHHWATEVRVEQSPWGMVEYDHGLRFNNQGVAIVLARTFCDLGGVSPKGAWNLAHAGVGVAWTMWGVICVALVAVGLRCVAAARRLGDARAWFDVTGLAMIGMLVVSPLVWTHYFIWVLPALIALVRHRRVLVWSAVLFGLALAARPLRGLGIHMWGAIAVYLALARQLVHRAAADAASD